MREGGKSGFKAHTVIMWLNAVQNPGFLMSSLHSFHYISVLELHGVAPLTGAHSMPPAPSQLSISNAYPNLPPTPRSNIRPP